MIYRFGDFELDRDRYRLLRGKEPVHVEPLALELLVYLIEHRDRLVTKEELLAALWADRFVSDAVLARCVHEARLSLGDDADRQRFIKTVRGRGYGFNATLEEIATDGAAPSPLDATRGPHNLRAARNRFIGRVETQREIRDLLATVRLLTLTGVGGCGKTRLALEVARALTTQFPEGVRLVELAPALENEVAALVAAGIGVPGFAGEVPALGVLGAPEEHLVGHVGEQAMLVVLDNCEHVREAVAPLVDRLLDACPNLVLLATSREPLEVPGETIRQVAPLGLPELEDTLEEAGRADAVRLFVERASAARAGFELSSTNLDAVVRICRRLDGIPLALELAAARVRHLAPEQIAELLEESFDLLSDRGTVVEDRHRTLSATMDWSYALLSAPEQALFRTLSVFVGGFGLDAAEGVCRPGALESESLLALLGSLIDRSLVVADDTGREVRYHLLETVRQYALDQLRSAGEEDLFRTRHRDFFASWVTDESSHRGLEASLLVAEVAAEPQRSRAAIERANLVAALEWSLQRREAEPALTLAGWSFFHFLDTGRLEEASARLDRALSLAGEGITEGKVIATFAQAQAFTSIGRHAEAYDLYSRVLESARAAGLERLIPPTLVAMGVGAISTRKGNPVELLEAAIDEATNLGQPRLAAFASLFLGACLFVQGDLDRAATVLEQVAQLASGGSPEHWACACRALVATVAGDLEAMQSWSERSARFPVPATPFARSFFMLITRPAIALAKAASGDRPGAEAALAELLDAQRSRPVQLADTDCLVAFAGASALLGEHERASRLLGAARATMAANQDACRLLETWGLYVALVHQIRTHLDPGTAARARDEGRAMSVKEALAYAEAGLDSRVPET